MRGYASCYPQMWRHHHLYFLAILKGVMDTKPKGFYSYIQEKPHHKMPIAVALICITVVSFAYTISVIFDLASTSTPASSTIPVVSSPVSTSTVAALKQKQVMIERLQNVTAQPLTRQEAVDIINFVSRGGATYTEAEKDLITKVLRAQ